MRRSRRPKRYSQLFLVSSSTTNNSFIFFFGLVCFVDELAGAAIKTLAAASRSAQCRAAGNLTMFFHLFSYSKFVNFAFQQQQQQLCSVGCRCFGAARESAEPTGVDTSGRTSTLRSLLRSIVKHNIKTLSNNCSNSSCF
jgi:hypothetical protein